MNGGNGEGVFFSPAFIIYKPQEGNSGEEVLFSPEAEQVLFFGQKPGANKNAASSLAANACRKWKDLLHNKLNEAPGSLPVEKGAVVFLEVLQSGRRKYAVKGTVLSPGQSSSPQKKRQYLFILERVNPGAVNFPRIFRLWKLTQREQEIVKLILSDNTNKEIAHVLGISLNTVKGYIKLLMRKLNVNTRAGIIAVLITNSPPEKMPKNKPGDRISP